MVAEDYPPILDTGMVAELLGMNIDTVRRLSRTGVLPAHRVPGGRAFKYLRDELIEWLRQQPAVHPAESAQEPADRGR